jgi:hypothetical protein
LETSRDFSAKTQGHIHNYVYKLEGLLAKGPELMESGESKRFKGVTGSLARHKKRI